MDIVLLQIFIFTVKLCFYILYIALCTVFICVAALVLCCTIWLWPMI